MQSNTELSSVLLAFYECLTDPRQLDTLMEMITSWLDDGEAAVVAPTLEHHANRAWHLLGNISEQEYAVDHEIDSMKVTHCEDAEAVLAVVDDQIRSEEREKLKSWLGDTNAAEAILLRVTRVDAADLAVISRNRDDLGFQIKRTGPEFQNLISKFVAESFDLTHAELTLVQQLLLGGTLREIAERLGKSWETTRSQVKSLTNKLGVSSQSDVLRMVNQAGTLMPAQRQTQAMTSETTSGRLKRPDGRTIIYEVDGPPSDKTLVFIHGMTQGRHWPDKARAFAKARGWRLVRISRAGRGQSSVNAKENTALLQDHVDDIMAVMNQERIEKFSIYAAADGFAVGYPVALQYPERVQMIIGIEVVPPILSRKVIDGFSGKMKTFGLACLYAPKTVKFMLGLAMHRLARMKDRYAEVHPLIGVVMNEIEDEDGIRADDRNFQDLMVHKAEGMWRDASYSCHDWAFAPQHSNVRPKAALIHCDNSMNKLVHLDNFAQRIGAPVYTINSYLPYISSALPQVLQALEPEETTG